MATKSNVFDVDTIKPRKGNELDISDSGHLKMNPKVENVNYDKKAKEGTFASRIKCVLSVTSLTILYLRLMVQLR